MICHKCGADTPVNAAFCPQCGAQLGQAGGASESRPAKAERLQSGVAQGAAHDIPEEELWSGAYSPKAMTAWYIVAIVIGIVGIVITSNIDPNGWMAVAIGLLIVLGCLALYSGYKRMSEHYRLTTHRFVVQKGLLSRTDNRILLVDIDDITVRQGLIQRMFNLGTITLRTTDETTTEESPDRDTLGKGIVTMDGIENPRQVGDLIDESRRAERTRRGVYMMNA
jgi:membrane protein YdbS with pleckstrin-like domain